MEENLSLPEQTLSSGQILSLIARMIIQLNSSLGNPSVQSAYITAEIVRNLPACGISLKQAVLLSLFHLFGFYHFLGENALVRPNLTNDDIKHYFTYGYHYLKEMTPLRENAKALLFYDRKYDRNIAMKIQDVEYASLIFTSASIQKMIEDTKGSYTAANIEEAGFSKFNPKYLEIFRKIDSGYKISNKIACGNYLQELDEIFKTLDFTEAESRSLMRVLVYIVDFKSTQTVQHIIHAAAYAVAFGQLLGCTKREQNELYTAGLLHDMGKLSIPNMILECAGKLSAFEYRVMQMHVEETESLLTGVVDDKVLQIAVRHHEKLNGKGYPNRLTAKDLTKQQQIMTIADIFSALVDKRSYKGKFPKEKVIEIFQGEADSGAIDKSIPALVDKHYDNLVRDCNFYGSNIFTVPFGKIESEYQQEFVSELEDLG